METNNATPRKRHVVIVDDNAELAWFFSEILKLHGYEATILPAATLALKYVLSHHTDVIICDLQMPQLDGDLFYATVERTQPALARQFIFVTGLVDQKRFHSFTATVAAPVLQKPVAVETLLAEIERILR
jgi:two-component system, sensor histidine kinase and response regulator